MLTINKKYLLFLLRLLQRPKSVEEHLKHGLRSVPTPASKCLLWVSGNYLVIRSHVYFGKILDLNLCHHHRYADNNLLPEFGVASICKNIWYAQRKACVFRVSVETFF